MSMKLGEKNQANELLYVGFNQDYGCFAAGTDSGFRVYNSDPFKDTFQREDANKGGIGYVEMLFRCNILALVGGGRNPRYPPNKVMIWDDHQNRCIGELSFRSEVKAVKLRRDKVVVVLEYKVYVYNFADLKLIDHIETCANPKGICALCPYPSKTVLVCPGLQKGHVRVELYESKQTQMIEAHESALACVSLNFDGSRLATASETGTLIRIFDTSNGSCLQELRRGVDRAEIHCIAFNPLSELLAVSSDKETVHIFYLKNDAAKEQKEEENKTNTKSTFSFMKNLLPKYFSSEWSFTQFRVNEPLTRTIVAFGEKNSIIVVSAEGMYYKATFDPTKPGEPCKQVDFAKFAAKSSTE